MKKKLEKIIIEDINEVISLPLSWDKLYGTTVVVTGAGGFIGSYFVKILLSLNKRLEDEKKIKVVGLVRNIERARINLGSIENDLFFSWYEWDLTSISIPELNNCNYIIHAASNASPKFYSNDPVGTILPNAVGTASLLTALNRSEKPKGFLFISSSEVYGDMGTSSKIDEDSYGYINPVALRSCYSESKRMGESICVAWSSQYYIPCYIVRPFHTYGPGLKEDDGRVFADFGFNIVNDEDIIVKSDGLSRRAFCYISDAMAGFFTVLLNGQPSKPYNVANENGVLSIRELAEMLVHNNSNKKLNARFIKRSDFDQTYLASGVTDISPDVSALQALGWSAKVGVEKGFSRFIEAYK